MSIKTRTRRYTIVIQVLFRQRQLTGKIQEINRGARHLSMGIRLSDPLKMDSALKLAEPMALSCGVPAVLSQRIEGLIFYQIQLPKVFWEVYTRQDLPSEKAVGLAEQKQPVEFDFEYPHALIAGTTGSGKSETLKSILVSLMMTHSPSELNFILIDPHRELDDFNNAAHLAMPIAVNAADIDNALAFISQELTQRKSENIKDDKMLVVAIDEAASDEIVRNPANLVVLKNVSKEARKYGIHLILGTQKPSHNELPAILDNLLNKWVGQLSDASISARVTGHAGLAAHKLTPKGDFLHIMGPDIKRLQIAMATKQDFDGLERGMVSQSIPVYTSFAPPVESTPGRPPVKLEAKKLAYYYHFGPNNITLKQADEILNLKRTGHELHRDFCLEFGKEYLKIRRGYPK